MARLAHLTRGELIVMAHESIAPNEAWAELDRRHTIEDAVFFGVLSIGFGSLTAAVWTVL